MLYIFGGLPATGKTELSRYLASTIGATYIRIDTIEQTLRNSGITELFDQGYQVAFALAKDNLLNGRSVVADSTNPVNESRLMWVNAAKQAKVNYQEIEVVCTDSKEHRYRVETRETDISGLNLPSWQSVISREYHAWPSANIVLDTAGKTPQQSKQELMLMLDIIQGKA